MTDAQLGKACYVYPSCICGPLWFAHNSKFLINRKGLQTLTHGDRRHTFKFALQLSTAERILSGLLRRLAYRIFKPAILIHMPKKSLKSSPTPAADADEKAKYISIPPHYGPAGASTVMGVP
jgi:hypothetical protein